MSELILPNGLNADILQIISQYSYEVYGKLRLVSKEVKEIIDEVLPISQNVYHVGGVHSRIIFYQDWRVNFLRRAHHWCGMKLLDQRGFEDWMEAIGFASRFMKKKECGVIAEKFCRDYLPKDGYIGRDVLKCLCRYNRKEYVCELWQEAKKSHAKRFHADCIQDIIRLYDFEFFKVVFDEFGSGTIEIYRNSLSNSCHHESKRWKNFRYFVENSGRISRDDFGSEVHEAFDLVVDYWEWLLYIKSHDKDLVLEAIKKNPFLLLFADESFQKDKDVVTAALELKGDVLAFAHESLRKDKDIVMTAVKNYGPALEYAHESLRKDRDIVMAAMTESSSNIAFKYVHKSLQNDKEIALIGMKNFAHDLKHASDSLRKDKDVVKFAVDLFGFALKHAHESLRKDRDVVMTAIGMNGCALEFADRSLRKDKDIVLQAVRNHGRALLFADESLQRDPEVVLEAFRRDKYAMKFADKSLYKDEQFVLQVVQHKGCFLDEADESLKKDKEFVMKAVKLNPKSLKYADKSFLNDPELLMEAAKQFNQSINQNKCHIKSILESLH